MKVDGWTLRLFFEGARRAGDVVLDEGHMEQCIPDGGWEGTCHGRPEGNMPPPNGRKTQGPPLIPALWANVLTVVC